MQASFVFVVLRVGQKYTNGMETIMVKYSRLDSKYVFTLLNDSQIGWCLPHNVIIEISISLYE